jgi:hypothetical protein
MLLERELCGDGRVLQEWPIGPSLCSGGGVVWRVSSWTDCAPRLLLDCYPKSSLLSLIVCKLTVHRPFFVIGFRPPLGGIGRITRQVGNGL